MQDYFLTTFKLVKFRIKKIQNTEISNIILSFNMVANPDLRSGFETDLNPDLTKNLDPD